MAADKKKVTTSYKIEVEGVPRFHRSYYFSTHQEAVDHLPNLPLGKYTITPIYSVRANKDMLYGNNL